LFRCEKARNIEASTEKSPGLKVNNWQSNAPEDVSMLFGLIRANSDVRVFEESASYRITKKQE